MSVSLAQQGWSLGPIKGSGLGPFGDISWGTTGQTAGEKLGSALSAIIGLMTVIAGLFFLIQLITGGIQWVGSGGDKAGLQQAQQKITNGFLGLTIVVAAIAVSKILSIFLGFDILNPAGFLKAIKFQ